MKIKKKYSYKTKRQIWRIIPSDTEKLIIEERETESKQVFFQCLHLQSGKIIFKNLQLDEKFWIGIESVYKDIIFFHGYLKPDMPAHKGIIAYDIENKKIIWENGDFNFLFPLNGRVYAYIQKFEGRNNCSLNYKTGEVVEELGTDTVKVNELRNNYLENVSSKEYFFPEIFNDQNYRNKNLTFFFQRLKNEAVVSGKIEFIFRNPLLLFCYHCVNSKGSLDNLFKIVDLSTGNYILEEILNKETRLYATDSFFIRDELLFVLFGKSKLVVYKFKN